MSSELSALQAAEAQAVSELHQLQTKLLTSQREVSSLQKDLANLAKQLTSLSRQVGSDTVNSLDKALAARQEELAEVRRELEARKREVEEQVGRVRKQVISTGEGYEEAIKRLKALSGSSFLCAQDREKALFEANTRLTMCKEQEAALLQEAMALQELTVPACLPYLDQATGTVRSERGVWGLALLAGVLMGVLGGPILEVSLA